MFNLLLVALSIAAAFSHIETFTFPPRSVVSRILRDLAPGTPVRMSDNKKGREQSVRVSMDDSQVNKSSGNSRRRFKTNKARIEAASGGPTAGAGGRSVTLSQAGESIPSQQQINPGSDANQQLSKSSRQRKRQRERNAAAAAGGGGGGTEATTAQNVGSVGEHASKKSAGHSATNGLTDGNDNAAGGGKGEGRRRRGKAGCGTGGEVGMPMNVAQSQSQSQPQSDNAKNTTRTVGINTRAAWEGPDKQPYFTESLFANLDVSAATKRAIDEGMGYKYLTEVQQESLPEVLRGYDVLVKAKTGTGKTLAFLIPAIEMLLRERQRIADAQSARARGGAGGGGAASSLAESPAPKIMILSPTRELAQQIAQEANTLCTFHSIGSVLLVGGTNMAADVRALKKEGPGKSDIIVATPGRLLAHLQETQGFAEQCKGVKFLIMDEADRLLDMGFKRDIDQIMSFLNRRDSARLGPRQTLLFSATVSAEVRQVANTALLPGYKTINTVGEDEEQTHAHVPQRVMAVPMEHQLEVLVKLIEAHVATNPENYKIILFFPTARQTGYYANVLNCTDLKVWEIHSRKSQAHRTRVAEQFRYAVQLI